MIQSDGSKRLKASFEKVSSSILCLIYSGLWRASIWVGVRTAPVHKVLSEIKKKSPVRCEDLF